MDSTVPFRWRRIFLLASGQAVNEERGPISRLVTRTRITRVVSIDVAGVHHDDDAVRVSTAAAAERDGVGELALGSALTLRT